MLVSGLLLGASLAAGVSPAMAGHDRFRSDGWTLLVHADRFTGQTRCRLAASDGRLLYQPGAVGFHAGRRDTLSSWYRVDDGAPVRWQDRTASLIGAGVSIDGTGLDDPTGGWVWIPISEVEHARTVAIRSDDRSRIRHYALGGFVTMLAAARRLGCGTDDAFRI